MKMQELRQKTSPELIRMGQEARSELAHRRFRGQTAQGRKGSEERVLKRDIARIETSITEQGKQTAAKKVDPARL
ncbi:50S ribosomal protein L29 [Candidatus Uhrbacteria bacterium]|nr:50S ribosomal protein L29 [Candidatus Uhrbacteria bacterium]